MAQTVKNLPAMQVTQEWSLGQEDPLEKGITTPVFLPGEFHGERSLVGYSPWGHKELDMTEQLMLLLSRQDQQEYWLKAVGGDFPLGQDGAAAISFTPSADTIDKTDKIHETIVLKTLDTRQQSTAIPERQKRKMSSVIIPAYCSEIVFISTPNWPEHTTLQCTQIIYQNSPYSGPIKQIFINLKGLKSHKLHSVTKRKLQQKSNLSQKSQMFKN